MGQLNDADFLQWIHDRLEFEHGDNHNVAHLHRLRKIINKKRFDEYFDKLMYGNAKPTNMIIIRTKKDQKNDFYHQLFEKGKENVNER